MNKEKLAINREAAKRMILKDMDLDYIKEITDLSKKQIRNIDKIMNSFVGENDYILRKRHASLHHLHFRYYFEDKTRFYTGVDLDRSEFYKNRYIQNGHNELGENIDRMEKYYANFLRLEAICRIALHMNDCEDLINACKMPHSWPEGSLYNYDLYHYIKYRIKDFEEKKMILNLLAVDENLKRIAFICNAGDETVEEVKNTNSMFFKNNKLNHEKLEKEMHKWEEELEYEIAKRTTNTCPAIEMNAKIFNIPKEELKKFNEQANSQKGKEYEIRKGIVENLMQDPHSLQDISEISGMAKFYANLIADRKYYDKYFLKYYDKYADEEMIEYKI